MKKQIIVEQKILHFTQQKLNTVFLRSQVNCFGSNSHVSRALNKLIKNKIIIRIGLGIYAQAKVNRINGKVVPIHGLKTLYEALNLLGIARVHSSAQEDYNSGNSTQVPTGRTIAVTKKTTRKIGYNGLFLNFEYKPNVPKEVESGSTQ